MTLPSWIALEIVLRHFKRGVLELEAVAEDDLVALARIVAERLLEGGGVLLQLDIADLGAELGFHALQRVVADAVPALFRDAAGHQKAHLEVFGLSHCRDGNGDGQRRHSFQESPS
jgi:hypothetical protein